MPFHQRLMEVNIEGALDWAMRAITFATEGRMVAAFTAWEISKVFDQRAGAHARLAGVTK